VFLLISLNKCPYYVILVQQQEQEFCSSDRATRLGGKLMRIRLVSCDRFLYRLCREVLLGFRDRAWDFGMVSSYEQARGSDLFLWDLPADMPFPDTPDFDPENKGIFLISRRHLKLLQRRTALAGFNLILKPVNPVLLRALLEEAISQREIRSVEGQKAEKMRLERDEMLQHLLQANLRLQEYDQDRTNFLAHSVHDFRAPLTAVQGYCALLLDGQLGTLNAEQFKVLERMQRSVRRLTRLTAGMFQMSVGPNAPRKPSRRCGDVQACIAQAVHEVTPVLESKQIQLRLDVGTPAENLLIDEMQIEQVMVNLLDNACRFTPRKGQIEVRAYPTFWDRRCPQMTEGHEMPDRRELESSDQNAFRIEVRDSGPGVLPGDTERIFEEYTTDSPSHDWSRAGLGLAICRRIVSTHHGIVFAESKGQGATFVVILPYAEKASLIETPQEPAALVGARMVSK
jgi:signal transduction histidine kinase